VDATPEASIPTARPRRTPSTTLLAGVLLVACAGDEPPPPPDGIATPPEAIVEMRDTAFEPEELTVAVGEEVTFSNEDDQGHQLARGTPDDFGDVGDRSIIDAGLFQVRQYDAPGTYEYVCTFHPDEMQFTLTVVD
jgi:plastocyanin